MNRYLYLILAVFVAGCVSAPDVPKKYDTPDVDARISILFLADKYPRHENVALTIFFTYTRKDVSKKDYESILRNVVSDLLKNRPQYEIVHLPNNEVLMAHRLKFRTFWSNNIKDVVKSELTRLSLDNELDYIFIIRPFSLPAWGNSSAILEGYGLYTRCVMSFCSAESLDQVSLEIYSAEFAEFIDNDGYKGYQRPKLEDVNLDGYTSELDESVVNAAADLFVEKFRSLSEQYLKEQNFVD